MAMPFALEPYVEAQRFRVEQLLKERLKRRQPYVPGRLMEAMEYSLLGGGKRLRGILCLTFAQAASGSPAGGGAVAEDAACAVEMVHSYSLIHDDLPAMDGAEIRRGRPTSHRAFGEAMAILAGDALLTLAFEVLTAGQEPERVELCRVLAQASGEMGMIAGQVMDISPEPRRGVDGLLQLHRLKTGALIRAACTMGVTAAGGRPGFKAAADAYGDAVGLAFQITDDVLDVSGDPAALGKRTGQDASSGRVTFPSILGVDGATKLAIEHCASALQAIWEIEPQGGPLSSLARFTVERHS